jgi:hypothetical protein
MKTRLASLFLLIMCCPAFAIQPDTDITLYVGMYVDNVQGSVGRIWPGDPQPVKVRLTYDANMPEGVDVWRAVIHVNNKTIDRGIGIDLDIEKYVRNGETYYRISGQLKPQGPRLILRIKNDLSTLAEVSTGGCVTGDGSACDFSKGPIDDYWRYILHISGMP